MIKKHTDLSCSSGFTLVELAIVMIIIGILIGGILKGQELIHNSRVTATIAQYKGLLAAHAQFYDKYNMHAGDMPNAIATARIPNCNAANSCNAGPGNGNSIIGPLVAINSALPAGVQENVMYWKHLALANLITGIDTSANVAAVVSGGLTHPNSQIGGVWNVLTIQPAAATLIGYGNGLRGPLVALTTVPNDFRSATAGVLVGDAAHIDRKLDDGMPNTGSISSEYQSQGCDTGNLATTPYNEANVNGRCVVLFRLQ